MARYALIVAGGSGTRLWPMSRRERPKQLIPFLEGRSLLQLAMDRLGNLIPPEQRYICAGAEHRDQIVDQIEGFDDDRFIGEPVGRDTLNAIGLGTAVIAMRDPDAVISVLTADHLIEPVVEFRNILERGFRLAEEQSETLVTFGVPPTHAATGYGYLQLGQRTGLSAGDKELQISGARVVDHFKEKPDAETAERYYQSGSDRYLWNSGMFVFRAQTMLHCIGHYEPAAYEDLKHIVEHWEQPERDDKLADLYPELRKTSIDYAVMEPASEDPTVTVAAVPMPLTWLDVGSWSAFGKTQRPDAAHNAVAAERAHLADTSRCVVYSDDPEHVVATVGCENLVVVHTADATLVCPKDRVEEVKKLHDGVGEKYGEKYL